MNSTDKTHYLKKEKKKKKVLNFYFYLRLNSKNFVSNDRYIWFWKTFSKIIDQLKKNPLTWMDKIDFNDYTTFRKTTFK
jgi:hypothetical protein